MNLHSKARLAPWSRAEIVRRILDLHQPVVQVAAAFGVSIRTVFKWLARWRAEGIAGLADRSSRPQSSPKTIHPLRVARVLALRRRKLPGFQIAQAAKLSKASVSRLLRRHAARLAALCPPPPICRYEHEHPGWNNGRHRGWDKKHKHDDRDGDSDRGERGHGDKGKGHKGGKD